MLHGDELGADLTQTLAEIDRRMLDFVVGLDTEFSELVNGSHLFLPEVALDDVVLPADIKSMVIDTARNFEAVRHARARLGSLRSRAQCAVRGTLNSHLSLYCIMRCATCNCYDLCVT